MSDEKTVLDDRPAVDFGVLIARVIVGFIFAIHGAQKLFPVFGGPFVKMMAEGMGPIAYLVSIGEFFGGLGIMFGFLTRFSAASNIVIMIGAIKMVSWKNGFFLGKSESSTLAEAGYEYHLALIGLLAVIMIIGPGRLAIGRYLPLPRSKKTRRPILILE